MQYGRSDDEWGEWADAARSFLVDRAKLRRLPTYTELNSVIARRTGHAELDFARDVDRAAMGHVLGLVSKTAAEKNGLMLSALVTYIDENDAGPGFYRYAIDLGLLPKSATRQQRFEFWLAQVEAVYETCR